MDFFKLRATSTMDYDYDNKNSSESAKTKIDNWIKLLAKFGIAKLLKRDESLKSLNKS